MSNITYRDCLYGCANGFCVSDPCNKEPYVGVTRGFKEEIEEWRKALSKEQDLINRPEHYNHGSIECIDYLKDNMTDEAFQGYLEGNAKKYLHRWRFKGKDKDLQKARWYLDYWIKHREQGA